MAERPRETVTEHYRSSLVAAIACSCCGRRRLTIAEVAKRVKGKAAKGTVVSESVVGSFLRGRPVRSDVLDAIVSALEERSFDAIGPDEQEPGAVIESAD